MPKSKKTAEQVARETEDLIAAAAQFVYENPICYVLKSGMYYMQRDDGDWDAIKPKHMANAFPFWNGDFAQSVTKVLADNGRVYRDATYSFSKDVSPELFNLSEENSKCWLKPAEGNHSPLFDVVIQSLCGNKPDAMEHLEHLIIYKYLHPEKFTIPCVVFHGQGGTGKNLLVNYILRTLYAKATLAATADHIVGDFNESIAGKVVAMLDEGTKPNTNEKLRALIGNNPIQINPKFVAAFSADNTAWYIISTNENTGGVFLDRSNADRRYSVIHVEKVGFHEKMLSLDYWIAVHKGWLDRNSVDASNITEATDRANTFMHEQGVKTLTDPQEIGKWLTYLIAKHGDKPHPKALHGADYDKLMEIQEPLTERVANAVFGKATFSHINRVTLFEAYKVLCRETNSPARRDRTFYAQIEAWLKANRPFIEPERRRIGGDITRCYVDTRDELDRLQANDHEYVVWDETRRSMRWVGGDY